MKNETNQEKAKKERSGTPEGMRDSLKKATTEMLVLFMLQQKPMYTYEMTHEIERITEGALTFNTLYLAIYRLQENGYIVEKDRRIEDGRARLYFAPTRAGVAYYKALQAEYAAFTQTLHKIFALDGTLYPKQKG